MRISKNAMLNLLLARQNDTMSDHTNDILLSSMGGTLSLIGSKNLYDAIDTKVREKDNQINQLNAKLLPFNQSVWVDAMKIYNELSDGGKEDLQAIFKEILKANKFEASIEEIKKMLSEQENEEQGGERKPKGASKRG